MVLEILFSRIDTLIASFYFTDSELACQVSWMNIVMVMDCFAYGFGLSIASSISNFIVKKDIYNSIKVSIISNATVFLFGCVFAILLFIFNKEIASTLIRDPLTIEKLEGVEKLYSPLIPIQLMQGGVYAVVRSLGKQNQMIILQCFANYIVHFGVLFALLYGTDLTNYALVYACGATYLTMCVGGIIIAWKNDWKKCSIEIRNELNYQDESDNEENNS